MHNYGKELISRSVQFLTRFEEEIRILTMSIEDGKGKSMWSWSNSFPKPPEERLIRWDSPMVGTVKINSDAAFLTESRESCPSAVARDHTGFVFISAGRPMVQCESVEEAEGRAAVVDLKSLPRMYRGPIILELDCALIAKELHVGRSNGPACFPVICELKVALSKLEAYNISSIPRERNKLAHELAARARREDDLTLIATHDAI